MRLYDKIEKIGNSLVQHGPNNDRVYLMRLHPADLGSIIDKIYELTILKQYTKIFALVPEWALDSFLDNDYKVEASIPRLYNGKTKGYFLAQFFSAKRSYVPKKRKKTIESIKEMVSVSFNEEKFQIPSKYRIRELEIDDVGSLAKLYKNVFEVYPFPIMNESYLRDKIESNVKYYGVFRDDKLVAASSAGIDKEYSNAEMTDFATHPSHLGRNLSYFLLQEMKDKMECMGIKTLYTIARATSHGMNKTFARQGFFLGGTLINNTLIGESIESMNVWYKNL